MLWGYPIELDDGSVADGLQYVVVFHSGLRGAVRLTGSDGLVGVVVARMQIANMGHHHQNNAKGGKRDFELFTKQVQNSQQHQR